MMYELNKSVCDTFPSLNPISILDYPAEDVFELIKQMVEYGERHPNNEQSTIKRTPYERPAGDDWV